MLFYFTGMFAEMIYDELFGAAVLNDTIYIKTHEN